MRRIATQLALYTLLTVIPVSIFAQHKGYSTKKRRAVKQYELALQAYDAFELNNAIQALDKAIKIDENFIEAHVFLSQVYQMANRPKMAIDAAEKAIAISPNFFPNLYFNLGNMLMKIPDYHRARQHLIKFTEFKHINKEMREVAELFIKSCDFAIEAMANPVPFEPINLGNGVNSSLDEYWPSLSASENTLVVTVKKPIMQPDGEPSGKHQEDFYISHRNSNGNWEQATSIGAPINSPYFNEGAQSITADGKTMYYTICRGYCNLYHSQLDNDGQWGTPKPLPNPINLPYSSEKQPSISPDGRTLYFVSNRGSRRGEFDIWRVRKLGEKSWSKPEKLSDSINTMYNEQSPFIHFDNKTLYFSSNGRVGMGGLDIYMARMINDSTWSTPKNLGYPINTHRDEDGLIVNAKGTMAYYSSDVDPNMGRDIYRFEIPVDIRPTPTSYITGTITDIRNGWPVRANFSLVDVVTDSTIMEAQALNDGTFLLTIPTNRSYALFASAPDYLYHSEHFDLKGIYSADKPFRKNIELTPIRIGGTMVMRNVFFETDSYLLKDESISELNKLTELLTINPTLSIEVGGHTDNVGSEEYNQVLSENRAKSVADYLLKKGIDISRITWKGYGLTKPIGDNSTEDGRAENRRTEIKITGI